METQLLVILKASEGQECPGNDQGRGKHLAQVPRRPGSRICLAWQRAESRHGRITTSSRGVLADGSLKPLTGLTGPTGQCAGFQQRAARVRTFREGGTRRAPNWLPCETLCQESGPRFLSSFEIPIGPRCHWSRWCDPPSGRKRQQVSN